MIKARFFVKARWYVQPDINTNVTIILAWNDLDYALVYST